MNRGYLIEWKIRFWKMEGMWGGLLRVACEGLGALNVNAVVRNWVE
jgi:hypothetical protein